MLLADKRVEECIAYLRPVSGISNLYDQPQSYFCFLVICAPAVMASDNMAVVAALIFIKYQALVMASN